MDFAVQADHRVKLKESEKKDKYQDLARELKKGTVKQESDFYTDSNWCSWYNYRRINKGTSGHGNKRTSEDHPNYSIVKIDQNTEKSPGDLRRLAVTQNSCERKSANTDVKNSQGVNDNNYNKQLQRE